MNAPVDHSEELTGRVLAMLKKRFYEGKKKLFFQESQMLKEAICYPAAYLEERSRGLPAERYESLLWTIVRGIVEHAGDIHSFGRYFLRAVQLHMAHHGEEYLQAAKSHSSVLEHQLMGIRKLGEKPLVSDRTTQTLAASYGVLKVKSGRKKTSAKTQQEQLGLL